MGLFVGLFSHARFAQVRSVTQLLFVREVGLVCRSERQRDNGAHLPGG